MARRRHRRVTVALAGPRVAEFLEGREHFAPGGDLRVGPGLYIAHVDAGGHGVELVVVGNQAVEVDDPDAIVRYALDLVNKHADGLASKADELRVEVSYG